MNGFNVATLNCRGAIKNIEQQIRLHSFFELNDLNVILLQETHVNSLDRKKEIDKYFNCDSYWSFGSSSSRGVAIIIFKNFKYEKIRFQTDCDGRVIYIDIKSEFGEIRLISIYAPNDITERRQFLKDIDRYFYTPFPLIAGGDWNFVENLNLDKTGGNPNSGSEGSVIFKNTKCAFDIIDPFRSLYKTKKEYTWISDTRQIKTRIDRFYINKFLKSQVRDVSIITSTVSDHYAVKMCLFKPPCRPFNIGKGIWKLNTSILADNNFIKEIENAWEDNMERVNIRNLSDWDRCKNIFRDIAMRHSKNKSKNFYKQMKELEEGRRQIECLMDEPCDNSFYEQLKIEKDDIVSKIGILYRQNYKGAMIRSNVKNLNENDQPNSSFLRIEIKNARKNLIEELVKPSGEKTKNTAESLEVCHKFYSNL